MRFTIGFTIGIILGVVLAFLVSLALASDPDDQCDYVPAPEVTWEGELNPNEFDKWRLISMQPIPDGIWVFITNPDNTSPIKNIRCYLKYGRNR